MKFKILAVLFMVCLFLTVLSGSSVQAGEWRFPVGLSYVGGIDDIGDLFEDNLEAEGYWTDSVTPIPVGIAFRPYFEFDSGLGIGMDFGPLMAVTGDVSFVNLPVNVNCRYAFLPDSNISPYIRGGIAYNLAGGDYVDSKNPGLFGAVGVEFLRQKMVGVGFEIAVDKSEIEFEDKRVWQTNKNKAIEPVGIGISIFAVF